ncbi:orotidine-5'-phosphate decarboxylase [Roseococcus sp. SDR]|uniref:orotidine-5'-phosphate decarboxylase n=1 Tax=Roseococcus sp. SDR TaxID=2835532 RepID=UPI001BCF410D|nr:orotidine-5'-phosphate decarboxylase [Roseococcus sp. SDR]MBS7792473.1 orotidine-5'-phosphate decarboxylase [Roseococcus sp. SDR]MBV1847787.1 orotidine-5'-phosphate decarboxylase [Roseococcus sp. SDR]
MLHRPTGPKGRLIVALDTPKLETAEALAGQVAPSAGLVKLGLELFCAAGPPALARLASHAPVFLDLKLHDIPNTVAGAVGSLAPLGASMLTLHAGGGPAMISAARKAAEGAGAARPILLAVTVLTSMDSEQLGAVGVAGGPAQQVLRLARMAMESGADGLVCSPREVSLIRDALGEAPMLVVPGIRPAGSAAGDQMRIATPEDAVAAGADWIVVGRPITGAADPGAAAAAITAGLTR